MIEDPDPLTHDQIVARIQFIWDWLRKYELDIENEISIIEKHDYIKNGSTQEEQNHDIENCQSRIGVVQYIQEEFSDQFDSIISYRSLS